MSHVSPLARTTETLLERANQLRRAGHHVQAANAYFDAALTNNNSRDALLFRAISYKDAKLEKEANAAYRYLLNQHPGFALGWSLYGTWLMNIAKPELAIIALEKAIDLDTLDENDAVATKNALGTARAALHAGRTAGAESNKPQTGYERLIEEAVQARNDGDLDLAAKKYLDASEAISTETDRQRHRNALLSRAIMFSQAKRYDDAADAYQTLATHHPDYPDAWTHLGLSLKNAGKHEDAIAALRQSLNLKSDVETRNALVLLLANTGKSAHAMVEGLRNLIQKDEQAVGRFTAREEKPVLAATSPKRPFNPANRNRNVIAFSLWGDDPVYVHGAIENARIAPHLYYGWKPRFYHDDSVPADAIDELRRAGAQTIAISDPQLSRIKPMWRFLASDDPEVDYFICRDADSRLNAQELLAVEEWLRSGKPFHIMRDHIYHMELILAGMWGGAAGLLPPMQETLIRNPAYFDNRFADQAFLANEIWPLIRDHTLTHDTYYHFNNSRQFPTAYRLPHPIHVGGGIKTMPHWRAGAKS